MKKNKIIICLLALFFSTFLVNNVYAFERHYNIKNYNAEIRIPTNYDVFYRTEDDSLAYNNYNLIDENEMDNYMTTLNAYFLATTQDLKKNIIFTRKQDVDTEKFYNLSELNEETINSLAEGFAQGFNINDYSIEKVNDITYVKLKYDLVSAQNEHLYYLKYKTIYNGYDYTVYIQKYSDIASEDEEELKKVIENFKIEKIDNPNKVSNVYTTPIWLAILFGIGYSVWSVYKKKRKDNNKNTKQKENQKKVYKCSKCGETFDHDFEICPKCKFNFATNEKETPEDKDSDENSKSSKNSLKETKIETDIDKKYTDLNKLKKLLDKDIITKEEFEKEKKKILKD